MPGPSVILLETDPTVEQQVTDVLSRSGFEVYTAENPDALMRAIQAAPFAVALVDADLPTISSETFSGAVARSRPETAVIYTCAQVSASSVLNLFRGGASDVLVKPFDPVELVARVRAVISQRRPNASASQPVVSTSPRVASGSYSQPSFGQGGGPIDRDAVVRFAQTALQTFLQLEREHTELQKQMRASTADDTRALDTWIAHDDINFVKGFLQLAKRLHLTVPTPMTTGGEILDRLGDAPPKILILSDVLPDIPTQLVVETIKSQVPEVNVIMVEHWGTPACSALLTSGSETEDSHRPMKNADDLVAILREARTRALHSAEGRDLTTRFRARHEEFLLFYADVMKMCDALNT